MRPVSCPGCTYSGQPHLESCDNRTIFRRASMDVLEPAATLLIKLGSIAVHVEEMMSPDGHAFDKIALQGLLDDPEVVAWLKEMDSMAFLPKKRT